MQPPRNSTIRQAVVWWVTRHPMRSAYQIARGIERDVASVSSECKRMADAGMLRRYPGRGPRGGYVYAVV